MVSAGEFSGFGFAAGADALSDDFASGFEPAFPWLVEKLRNDMM
ncbi:hypothetical protein TH47_12790 [Thalassospira sp. MCCC 1A02803]|nr:hypothetical protein TH47_12790 [Thalassospira sp. MCCC 1A02803]